ncbi:GIY-YIG nuclease family protein (plasmid) [Pedobacter sp. BS3]|uniref:GIY-YIG nuclease family protein n=1 Tax=Pedobacter sp. BS3 TaxID=2567937 RepID=UPI0011ECE4BF|nr:GIY-YIG nuclease family protein [Pedobacter sp. BS3]TZF85936.1 GIY-YIG nuclease family protein [Pedobacter sp. BS3]
MFTVYVLHSKQFNKIYIGYTSDLNNRLLSHNQLATKGYTVKFRPWEIIYTEIFATKTEAIKREKQLKSATGRDFIRRQLLMQ